MEKRAVRSGTLTAARFMVAHLEESATVIGYRYAREAKIDPEYSEGGLVGHRMTLRAPTGGFSDFQKDRIESYGRSLGVWKRMVVEFEWTPGEAVVHFRDIENDEESTDEDRKDWKERFRSRSAKSAYAMSKILVNQGFMVRAPTSASLMTLKDVFNGVALLFKYPVSREHDEAGIAKAYDKWVPMLADAMARDAHVRADTIADGDMTTVFFTANKNFLPALYEVTPSFRMLVPRKAKSGYVYFAAPTYRACRALTKEFKKYFEIKRKPMRAWKVDGHSVILTYKRGAGGKLIDDSYIRNVSLHCERLMKKYGRQCFIQHEEKAKALIVTFYSGMEDWGFPNVKVG